MSRLKDDTFLQMARVLGRLSTCSRADVGAIITKEGRAISWGYNGAPPGMDHCDHTLDLGEGCTESTHAEANAVAFAARQGISTEGGTLYVSVSPCDVCARLLIAAGIVRVVPYSAYRLTYGLEILELGGVDVDGHYIGYGSAAESLSESL